MKLRIFLLSLALCSAVWCSDAYSQNIPANKLIALINQSSDEPGFEIVKVNQIGVIALKSFISNAVKGSDDPKVKQVLKMMDGIRKVMVVEYSECDPAVRDNFNVKASRYLSRCEPMMAVKDSGTDMKMFGLVSADGSTIRDFVLYSANECVLICLFGKIPLDLIRNLSGE